MGMVTVPWVALRDELIPLKRSGGKAEAIVVMGAHEAMSGCCVLRLFRGAGKGLAWRWVESGDGWLMDIP